MGNLSITDNNDLRIGTCSWNYDSWVELVYSKKCRTASEYLGEYSSMYNTVEIDSWFYKMPSAQTVQDYLNQVDDEFRFTCKVPNRISLTHLRNSGGESNPDFLSPSLFNKFLSEIEPMLPRIDALMLEFEYLNREKMESLSQFLSSFEDFLKGVESRLPIAVEIRNSNYLHRDYFELLKAYNVIHVFSEKTYMPPIHEIYNKYKEHLTDSSVIRLLGENRAEIEKKARNKWNRILEPKDRLGDIVAMIQDMTRNKMKVTINVNNHYEGSAPITIDRIFKGLSLKPKKRLRLQGELF